ncbi:MAG: tetratricopeptide repeat protein [Gemmatimonadetes bacterium]|nr:tetratricopeptide repeat protein [Gemmatimonadota bacterium]MDA1104594.1 tetratricopeptide repeat protein [Gemmatimonadota bacterium]
MHSDHKQARQIVARGVSAWERDDFESALETFQGVLEDFPQFADVQNKAGLCLAMLNRLEESLVRFEAAVQYNPTYAEAHLNRGIILNDLGRHEEAQVAFSKAGELDSLDSPVFPSEVGNRIAVTHAQLGDLYLVANHPSDAIEHYRSALQIRPRFMDIRSKFAETLIELGELDQAKDELTLILEARPSFVGARVRMGVVLHRLGDDERAVLEWQRCLQDDPRDMRARAYLASVQASGAEGGEA